MFVEVKTRVGEQFGGGAEAVTAWKQRRMTQMAVDYLARHRLHDRPCRFDVVAIDFDGGRPRIQVYAQRLRCASVVAETSLSELSEKIPSPAAGSSSPPSAASVRTTSGSSRSHIAPRRMLSVLRGARGHDAARGARVSPATAAAPNGPGWDLRVVPNKFPALQVEGTLDRAGRGAVRPDERHRRARGDHRDAAITTRRWRRCRSRRSSGCCGRSASGCST